MGETGRTPFRTPPTVSNLEGDPRKVGFEMEFAGDDLESFADAVKDCYGGAIESANPFTYSITGTRLGDFTVELDAKVFHDRLYRKAFDKLGVELPESFEEALEKAALDVTSGIIPFELTSPPIPITDLETLHDLEDALRERKPRGTTASPIYAFGAHINPETPDFEAETILSYIQAFLLLLDWLKKDIDIDLSRTVPPFIDDYPEEYEELVLDPDYAPDYQRLVDDYLTHNPTRNRGLDLTALFAHKDPDGALQRVEDGWLVKPRPTFHYRLANCDVDRLDWSLAAEWNRWVEVERLAGDRAMLRKLLSEHHTKKDGLEEWLARLADLLGL